jgi:hypothetical protein
VADFLESLRDKGQLVATILVDALVGGVFLLAAHGIESLSHYLGAADSVKAIVVAIGEIGAVLTFLILVCYEVVGLFARKRREFTREAMFSQLEHTASILGYWHQYNVTHKNGQYFWIHAEYNITVSDLGEIRFDVEYVDNKGDRVIYRYEGAIRDDRVVLIGKPISGKQPCFVEVWPHLGNSAAAYHLGVCWNQSWDMNETLIPCLLSRKPLCNSELDGKHLTELWRTAARSANIAILPGILDGFAS